MRDLNKESSSQWRQCNVRIHIRLNSQVHRHVLYLRIFCHHKQSSVCKSFLSKCDKIFTTKWKGLLHSGILTTVLETSHRKPIGVVCFLKSNAFMSTNFTQSAEKSILCYRLQLTHSHSEPKQLNPKGKNLHQVFTFTGVAVKLYIVRKF